MDRKMKDARDFDNKGASERSRRGFRIALLLCFLLPTLSFHPSRASAQAVTDKMVATVNGGVRVDLITYSDILWQIALQPDTPIDNPGSEILNRALRLLLDQRLILQEAERLPSIAPTDAEIRAAIEAIAKRFPAGEFERRLRRVGFSSVEDDRLIEIIRQRVAIEKYLDFRFRSFTVVSPEEVANYYRDVYVPRFRQRNPGRVVPTLDQTREELERTLTESKIESDTNAFLDAARERAEIVILNPV